MTVLVNSIVLGLLSLFTDPPEWDTAGIVALMFGGVLGSLMGRFASLRATRLVGATRASAFMTGTPLVAAFAGWVVLDERMGLVDAAGGLLVIAGLLALVRARSSGTAMLEGQAVTPARHVTRRGFIYATAAPVFFGLSFVVKKWGLLHYPNVVLGAFLGTVAALLVVVGLDIVTGRISQRLRENFRHVPWWFVGAGVAMSGALLAQLAAFTHLEAWLVGALQSTQGLWALFFAWLVIRREEKVDSWVVTSVVLVVLGVVLIGIQV